MPSSESIEAIVAQRWADVDPAPLENLPAQLNLDERQLLFHLARNYFTGVGEIVDAGSFLGGSASCLALGLRDNPRLDPAGKAGRIHSYDIFTYAPWIGEKWLSSEDYSEGQSFLSVYHDNLGELAPHVAIHPGPIESAFWRSGPIEILFLDVCKTPMVSDAAHSLFLPHAIPGRTVFIQQDYTHPSWNIVIYATRQRLKHRLRLLTATRRNSVAYLVAGSVTKDDLSAAASAPNGSCDPYRAG